MGMDDPVGSAVAEFWDWFRDNAESIAEKIDESSGFDELDRRVLSLSPGLSWDIGQGLLKSRQFVISPSLNRDLREIARLIVANAPKLDDWEFHSARQPKDWNYRVEVTNEKTGEITAVNATDWRFVLLTYPDGFREILIETGALLRLSDERRQEIGEIVLLSLLGEDSFMDSVDNFELTDRFEPQFAQKARRIQQLRSAVTGGKE